MKKLIITIAMIWAIYICPTMSYAIHPNNEVKGLISGEIIDANTKHPLEFATVSLFNALDSTLIQGTTTNRQGKFSFEVSSGTYYIQFDFISYQTATTYPITITSASYNFNLGKIPMTTTSQVIEEVEIRAEKSSTQIMLDKKVFNVGQDLVNQGGSAQDILDNVPSLNVDVDGQVSLRGNENVKILVDGKPSGLVGIGNTNGLKSIPANMIDKVEVITNPSSRYEAEGSVGIINIILKKDKRNGLNGSVNLTGGYNGFFVEPVTNSDKFPFNAGAAINLNYRRNKFNFFVNTGLDKRVRPGGGTTYQETYGKDTLITENKRQQMYDDLHLNIRLGADYHFSPKDVLTVSFIYRPSNDYNYSEVCYTDSQLENGINLPLGITLRSENEIENQNNLQSALTYHKKFKEKGRKFSADFRLQNNTDYDYATINEFFDIAEIPSISSTPQLIQSSMNNKTQRNILLQVDYVHPFSKNGKWEVGYRGTLKTIQNDFEVKEKIEGASDFNTLESLSDNFIYDENIQAVYANIGDKKDKFSYQFGMRYEHASISTTSIKLDSTNTQTYKNPFFPSAFLSYDLSNKNAVQLSYSRRVRRPGFRELNPNLSFTDARNRTGGNPNLTPSFTHLTELSYIKYFEKGTFTGSAYYRLNTESIVRLSSLEIIDGDTITLKQPFNLGNSSNYGLDLTFNAEPTQWFRLNGNFNFFKSILPRLPAPPPPNGGNNGNQGGQGGSGGGNQGSSGGSGGGKPGGSGGNNGPRPGSPNPPRQEIYSWFVKVNTIFTIDQSTNVQLRFNYRAPQETIQGSREAIYFVDFAASRDVLDGKGTLTFNFRDIFNTREWNNEIRIKDELYSYNHYQWRSGSFGLAFTYHINQSKKQKKPLLKEGKNDLDGNQF